MADDWPGDMPGEFRKGAAFAERIAADEIAALRARVAELEAALRLARAWGIESMRYSAIQSGDLAEWFDNGCKGPPPKRAHLGDDHGR